VLRTQYVSVDFFGGIDTKTDPKLLQPVKLTNLENARFNRSGLLQKRNGYTAINTPFVSSGMAARSSYLLVRQKSYLNIRNDSINQWAFAGYTSPFKVSKDRIPFGDSLGDSLFTFDIIGNIGCYAVSTAAAGSFASIVIRDEQSKTVIRTFNTFEITTPNTVFYNPKVVAVGTYFYIFFANSSSNLCWVRIDSSNPTSISALTTIAGTTMSAGLLFDVCRGESGFIFFALNRSSGSTIAVGWLQGLLATPTVSTVAALSPAEAAVTVLRVYVDPSTNTPWVLFNTGTANTPRFLTFNTAATPTITPAADFYTTTGYGRNLQMSVCFPSAGVNHRIWTGVLDSFLFATGDVNTGDDSITNAAAPNFFTTERVRFVNAGTLPAPLVAGTDYFLTKTATTNNFKIATSLANAIAGTPVVNLTTVGVGSTTVNFQDFNINRVISGAIVNGAGSTQIVFRGMRLATDIFHINGESYFGAVTDSNVQRHIVFFRYLAAESVAAGIDNYIAAVPVGSCLWNSAKFAGRELARPVVVGNTVSFVIPEAISLDASSGQVEVKYTGSKLTLDFASVSIKQSVEAQSQLAIAGGLTTLFDGAFNQEVGFLKFPEGVTGNVITSGTLLNNQHGISVVYEYLNATGNIVQSIPSLDINVTPLASNDILLDIPVCGVSLRNRICPTAVTSALNPQAVNIAIYVRPAPGQPHYRVASLANTMLTASVGYRLQSVSDLAPLLYTDSGELENAPPPPSLAIANNKNRAAVISSEDPTQIWFSKFYYPGKPLQFSDAFIKRIDGYGPATSIATMDDKWIVWTENSTHFWSGDGPLDNGQQDTFTDIELVTTDVGCVDPSSVVSTPVGLIFKSKKGFRLLTRSLSVENVGADVEKFNDEPCVDGTLVADQNEVRFLTPNRGLVYDYIRQQWAVWSNHSGINAGIWQGAYVYLRPDGLSVYKETPGFFKDNNVTYPLKIETAWLKLAGIQNFQRIRRASIIGEFKGEHILKMSVGYDYEDYYIYSTTWDAGAVLDVGDTFGDEVVFGGGDVFGGPGDNIYQVQYHMPRQKCESIRFKLEDLTNPNPNEAYTISNMTLECGVKSGLNKIRVEKTVG
jgi:hypothetical protein